MNERLFQRIEVWLLDVVIEILSNQRPARTVFRNLNRFGVNKSLLFMGLILGSTFIGLLIGYSGYILTNQIR